MCGRFIFQTQVYFPPRISRKLGQKYSMFSLFVSGGCFFEQSMRSQIISTNERCIFGGITNRTREFFSDVCSFLDDICFNKFTKFSTRMYGSTFLPMAESCVFLCQFFCVVFLSQKYSPFFILIFLYPDILKSRERVFPTYFPPV